MEQFLGAFFLLVASSLSFAATVSVHINTGIIGVWKTIDESTGRPSSLIRFVERRGIFFGTLIKTFRQPGEKVARCTLCKGALRNRPVEGMQIIQGLRWNAENNRYEDGLVFDPRTAKTYRCRATLAQNGKVLEFRGYFGVSWLGETHEWLRYSR
ncbi:MAG: hypothetical protein A3J38_08310 [Gammaproteobacteria bacterium RIFCSPHIGHO2_12_FULL_45_9]|nr:MAG: hypothetical protein A3J38_08310 [Gammaproteobacteria bacterium RIFCSPHIGHO2_12_FULL_45_9]